MDDQHEGDKILHQDAVEEVIEEVLSESSGPSFLNAYADGGTTSTVFVGGWSADTIVGDDISINPDGVHFDLADGLYHIQGSCSSADTLMLALGNVDAGGDLGDGLMRTAKGFSSMVYVSDGAPAVRIQFTGSLTNGVGVDIHRVS
jgi:hypothetical protein